MIVVVGMNFKEESCLIIDEPDKLEFNELTTTANERKTKISLPETPAKQGLQLTTN
jgi:hypothetical protein